LRSKASLGKEHRTLPEKQTKGKRLGYGSGSRMRPWVQYPILLKKENKRCFPQKALLEPLLCPKATKTYPKILLQGHLPCTSTLAITPCSQGLLRPNIFYNPSFTFENALGETYLSMTIIHRGGSSHYSAPLFQDKYPYSRENLSPIVNGVTSLHSTCT
jgi:hypothetical protein